MKKLRLILLLVIASVIFVLPFRKGVTEERIVLAVVDGDTLRIRDSYKGSILLRLIGIDAPELHENSKTYKQARNGHGDIDQIEDLGARSQVFVKARVKPGDAVDLKYDTERTDKYGRLLAYAYLKDGTFLNLEIMRAGYAMPLTFKLNVEHVQEFRAAYEQARAEKRGLWTSEIFADQGRRKDGSWKKFPDGSSRMIDMTVGPPGGYHRGSFHHN